MTEISVIDYRPDPALDAELAELGYAAVHGWPDQQPLTASVVRSALRPTGLTATTLALHRDGQGRLRAAAAVRWPATLDATGWLWGPMVHPDASGAGLGRALLDSVREIISGHPGVRVKTAQIPETRTAGWAMFERAGWQPAGTRQLLKRSLPATDLPPELQVPTRFAARTVRRGEYLDQVLAALVSDTRPEVCYATARDTHAQWIADARYTPDGLLLVDGPDGLNGAALVYPLRHDGEDEPPEALIAELLVSKRLDSASAADVRTALVLAALRAGDATGAAVARAVVDDPALAATLRAAGFRVVDNYRHYSTPLLQRPGPIAGSVPAYA